MAEMTSILPALTSAISSVSRFSSATGLNSGAAAKQLRAQQDLALKQLKDRQGLEESLAQQKFSRDTQIQAADAADTERRRVAALKRVVAKQRAEFGGSGIDPSGGGSADAVLLGLFQESDTERQAREQMDQLKQAVLSDTLSNVRANNLLESAQLAARQQLQSRFA